MRSVFDTISGISSIIGLIVSIITLVLAAGIKKSILKHEETRHFRNECEQIIKVLDSFAVTIKKDNIFTESLLNDLIMKLDTLVIRFETVLNKRIKTKVKKLQSLIKNECLPKVKLAYKKNDCSQQLNAIIELLKKEADMNYEHK